MRWTSVLAAFLLASLSSAFDSVIWSSQPLNDKSVEELVSSATADSPIVIYTLKGFTLATFSREAEAYSSKPSESSLIKQIRDSKEYSSQFIKETLQVPTDAVSQSAKEVSSKSVSLFDVSSWADLEKLENEVAALNLKSLTSVISSPKAFSTETVEERQKRASSKVDFSDDEEGEGEQEQQAEEKSPRQQTGARKPNQFAAIPLPMPVVLPPFNVSGGGYTVQRTDLCLLYLEGVRIIVEKTENSVLSYREVVIDAANGTNTFGWSSEYVNCSALNNATIGTAKFVVEINVMSNTEALYDKNPIFTIAKGQTLKFELVFFGNYLHYWNLTEVNILSGLTLNPSGTAGFLTADVSLPAAAKSNMTRFMGVESFYQYAYACSATQAAFFETGSAGFRIGLGLNNFEVDLKAFVPDASDSRQIMIAFNRDVNDCVGTFSVGSWMGIVCSLVLASILMFGYLMLQSVQTMDRFDDPKQKQIVINFKE